METIKETKGVFIDTEVVNQLLDLLKQNQKVNELSTVQDLSDSINFIENSLNSAINELQNVKAQLNINTPTVSKSKLNQTNIKQVEKLATGVERLKNQLNIIKRKFIGTAQNIVDSVKEKGISALDKTSEFISLKEKLTALNEGINNNISKVDKNIKTINAMTQEFNAASKHIKNVGRAMTGKERDGTMVNASESMVKPLRKVKRILVSIEKKSANSIAKVESLSKRAGREEKPSVLQRLKAEKANISEPTVVNHKSKEMSL